MKLSYVITTRNRRESLLRTLGRLERETGLPDHEWEVLVVDNGSSDGTGEALAGQPRATVICLAENEGVPARNLAIARAAGRYVALLSDDVHPIDRAIPRALDYLAHHSKTAAIVPRIVLPDGSAQAPALPTVLMGSASIVRKSALDRVGVFAPEFFRQVAEYDLSFRIWSAGLRIERFEDVRFAREQFPDAQPSEWVCRMDLRNNLILAERYLSRPLRRAYRHDWLRRYALLALQNGHELAANAALKEARVWARREEAVGRKTLDESSIESIFQIQSTRKAVADWSRAHKLRRVCIADWGKNLFAAWQACRAAEMKVSAILENTPAFSGRRYRGVRVVPDSDAPVGEFDGIVLAKISPAEVAPRAAQLEACFGLPVLRLWHPHLLDSPPANLSPPRDVDEAA